MPFNPDELLDDLNLKIMDMLGKDSSVSFVEVAKQIDVSDATIHNRVQRLIAAGIINKFTISVDNNRLGYSHLAYMGINIECGFVDDVTDNLCKVNEVLEVHEMHGIFDLFIKIRAKDLDQLRDIVQNKICRFPHILETELMTVLKTGKEEHMMLCSSKKDRIIGLNY
ncbi:MAG: Lrp/AsnC family transcriptional regulator [Thermoproteota archaeon]|jgi:Lrp/AsnC family transcriptional regulator for asnA, asnC and gidA|nr:Lrp/AsnC family transcriptional regulator [Thermoproteota archaeon]